MDISSHILLCSIYIVGLTRITLLMHSEALILVAVVTVLIYDHQLTFREEVSGKIRSKGAMLLTNHKFEYIWKQEMSFVSFFSLLNI